MQFLSNYTHPNKNSVHYMAELNIPLLSKSFNNRFKESLTLLLWGHPQGYHQKRLISGNLVIRLLKKASLALYQHQSYSGGVIGHDRRRSDCSGASLTEQHSIN
jgi:hypothetical protein